MNVFVRDLDLPVINNLDERSRSCLGRFALVPGRAARNRHHPRVSLDGRRSSEAQVCCWKTVHHWNEPEHGKRGAIQNSWVQKAGPGWLCLGVKCVEDSLMRHHFLRSLASAKVWGMSELLKGRAHAALMRSMLGCTAARSYALSLLDRVPAGADGPTPFIHEVMRDHRHEL